MNVPDAVRGQYSEILNARHGRNGVLWRIYLADPVNRVYFVELLFLTRSEGNIATILSVRHDSKCQYWRYSAIRHA
ncbi:MAG: hypothetical protein JEZ14_15965 [Marinilabiliaceae bacterium]|nr:hypothetical protein [Marinilabiliaceae bacterium]